MSRLPWKHSSEKDHGTHATFGFQIRGTGEFALVIAPPGCTTSLPPQTGTTTVSPKDFCSLEASSGICYMARN